MTNPRHFVQLEQFSYINDYRSGRSRGSTNAHNYSNGQFHRAREIQPMWIDEDTFEDTYVMAGRLREERLREKRSSQPNAKTKKTTIHFTTSCSICLEEFGNETITSTDCGHLFHFGCLEKALETKKECPNCRTDL